MIRRPPRSTRVRSSAASDVYKRQIDTGSVYAPVQKQDPGADGKLGTADDGQFITVYNKTNPGHEFLLFTNPANAFRDYKGFQLIGTKRYSRNWQASLSY